jgi:hypothetical protein
MKAARRLFDSRGARFACRACHREFIALLKDLDQYNPAAYTIRMILDHH